MRKIAILIGSVVLVLSLGACTPKQKAEFMCKVKYGPNVHGIVESNGDAGCYSLGGGIHKVTCQEDMKCWDCKTMGNHICGGPGSCIDGFLWNGQDHRCESPRYFCKRVYGPKAVPKEDRKGNIECEREK